MCSTSSLGCSTTLLVASIRSFAFVKYFASTASSWALSDRSCSATASRSFATFRPSSTYRFTSGFSVSRHSSARSSLRMTSSSSPLSVRSSRRLSMAPSLHMSACRASIFWWLLVLLSLSIFFVWMKSCSMKSLLPARYFCRVSSTATASFDTVSVDSRLAWWVWQQLRNSSKSAALWASCVMSSMRATTVCCRLVATSRRCVSSARHWAARVRSRSEVSSVSLSRASRRSVFACRSCSYRRWALTACSASYAIPRSTRSRSAWHWASFAAFASFRSSRLAAPFFHSLTRFRESSVICRMPSSRRWILS
mmetsp:Transcript_136256/g.236368  ORF Transcript_136256/g.236368 Transcript_136256/m.236368 type:complete len:309 (-) Transcript_136256:818-1744(-)